VEHARTSSFSHTDQHAMLRAEEWRAGVAQALQAAGYRNTVPPRAIVAWIAHLTAPFTAETLVDDLEQRQSISSRATIYRLIEWLHTEGWIARICSDAAEHTYARMLPGHHHHAVCTRCGSTLIIGGCDIEAWLAPLVAETDFEVHGHKYAGAPTRPVRPSMLR
jgi:Fur family ferric uptake transcriptional regulator